MPSPTRSDLEQAAATYFGELASELDQDRNFQSERLDEEVSWNIECSRNRISQLDDQLRANSFEEAVRKRASNLAQAGGWPLADLDEREMLFAFQLAARAEREQMLLLIHMLSNPHRPYVADDQTFGRPIGSGPASSPIQTQRTSGVAQLTLREAVTDYVKRQSLRNLGKSQIEELERALMWLREVAGDLTPLPSVGTSDLRTFRDDLARLDVTLRGRRLPFKERLTNIPGRQIKSVTALRYWRSIRTFFAWCAAEQLLPDDPAAGLRLDMKKGEVTRTPPPFTQGELERLFETPLFAGYKSVKRVTGPGPCRKRQGHWWSAVLLLFTGLRAGELSQLLPDDFIFDAEVPHLKVRELDGEGRRVKSTKNKASIRDVPLAPVLLQLGLREFIGQRGATGPQTRVFREFRLGSKDRKSDGVSKFWAMYLRRFDLWKEGRSTHVFRHTVVACLRSNDAAEEDIASIVGHTGRSITASYGGAYPLPRKLRTIEQLDYGFDVLSKLGGLYDRAKHDW